MSNETIKSIAELLDTLPGRYGAAVTVPDVSEADFRLQRDRHPKMNKAAAEALITAAVGGGSVSFSIGHQPQDGRPTGYVMADAFVFTRDQLGKLLSHIYMEGARSSWPLSVKPNGTKQ